MTDEELLTQIVKEIENLLVTKYTKFHVKYFMQIARPDVEVFISNACALCMIASAMQWANENDIQHLEDDTISGTKH